MTAGIADMTIWMVDCRQRPAMFELTSRSDSLPDSIAKDEASEAERPMVRPSRIPLTDSDSCTIEESNASWRCLSLVMPRRSLPTRRLTHTNTGSVSSEAIVSRQSRTAIAMTVAVTVVRLDTSVVAVVVTVACMPPMSLAMRDCTSPVRVDPSNRRAILLRLTDRGAAVRDELREARRRAAEDLFAPLPLTADRELLGDLLTRLDAPR
jgi:hypothetical protein